MTFCLGITVKDGLVGIADTRVTMGTECIIARKLSVYNAERRAMFVMTSGLRSIRDKAITYFDAALEEGWTPYDRLFKAVNLFAEQVRRVAAEDRMDLQASGINFDLHSLVGGQLDKDPHHKLYLVYPQGNWVEIGQGTPYHIIGAAGYGKPILDRTLHFADPLPFALKVGCLAFDSTRISAADVSFPLDVVICAKDTFQAVEQRYAKEDLAEMSSWWQDRLRRSINELPGGCIEELLSRLRGGGNP